MELLVVLVIASILATAATAGYRQHLRRTSRTDATAALLRIAVGQERFYLQNDRYATTADELAAAPPAGLGITGTEHGYYTLVIAPAGDATVGYTAIATADPGRSQADDSECRVFRIDQSGHREAAAADGGGGATVTERCWR